MHAARARTCLLLAALAAPALAACANETVLHERTSAYNTIIVTERKDGMRVARFDRSGALQSISKPGDPTHLGFTYLKIAFVGLSLVDDPRRILVVGVGGGTMPMFLRRHYPNAAIDAVDIDPDVVAVAKEYFGFREDDRLKAHISDGRAFIEEVRDPYNVVLLDAFGAHDVPPPLTTIEFLRAVRRALTSDGVVVWNVWGGGHPPLDDLVRTYQEVFDEVYRLDVPNTPNRILLGLPQHRTFDHASLVALARTTGAVRGFPFDLGAIEARRFHRLDQRSVGRILRDADIEQIERSGRHPR